MTVEPGKTLRLSRNEIESLCTTAARGADMSWGLAEEAGYAAGWLASRGLDGGGSDRQADLCAVRTHYRMHGCRWQGEWGRVRSAGC